MIKNRTIPAMIFILSKLANLINCENIQVISYFLDRFTSEDANGTLATSGILGQALTSHAFTIHLLQYDTKLTRVARWTDHIN